jgi:hypothetical protein
LTLIEQPPAARMFFDQPEYRRIAALGVDWVLRPATQPWAAGP